MSVELKKGDIFLTRGHGLLRVAIRFFTRSFGERRTKVNHVGVVVEDGDLRHAIVVEARRRVVMRTLWGGYGPPKKDSVTIFRATNLSGDEIRRIVVTAESYVGRSFGVPALIAHFLDWLLLGAYVFRRFANMEKYPICSWLVAHSFAEVGKDFGVPPGMASPDDIWDFVNDRRDIYTQIRRLEPLTEDE